MKKAVLFMLSTVILFSITLTPIKASAATVSSTAGQVNITSGALNIRSGAGTGFAKVGSLSKSSYITLISKSNDWWKVEYKKGSYGYCHSDYIKTVSSVPMTVNITSGTLNVRKGAGTEFARISSLSKGETVLRLSVSGQWSRVLFAGSKVGYVSSEYLKQLTSYPKISLKVPSFKQTDSRWANVKIGTSGKTISQIGCATTGIAMMESYRTGQTIYPDAMSKKLKYTSSGSVYWPGHFTTVTDSSGYLTKIYNLLKQGKPVLLGAKNSSGGQHWVVITGYTGGTALVTSGFTINDPGSNTRVKLSQFLSAYPKIYKYFYY